MNKPDLPEWAQMHPHRPNTVLVDPDLAYPAFLKELGIKKPTKYWLETVFQCVKLDLQVAMRRFDFTIMIRADDGRKERWALRNHPGRDADVERATKGREAREHYRRLRGFIPG